jgi:hypothetical protein
VGVRAAGRCRGGAYENVGRSFSELKRAKWKAAGRRKRCSSSDMNTRVRVAFLFGAIGFKHGSIRTGLAAVLGSRSLGPFLGPEPWFTASGLGEGGGGSLVERTRRVILRGASVEDFEVKRVGMEDDGAEEIHQSRSTHDPSPKWLAGQQVAFKQVIS